MTVDELIEELKKLPPEQRALPVCVHDTTDWWEVTGVEERQEYYRPNCIQRLDPNKERIMVIG